MRWWKTNDERWITWINLAFTFHSEWRFLTTSQTTSCTLTTFHPHLITVICASPFLIFLCFARKDCCKLHRFCSGCIITSPPLPSSPLSSSSPSGGIGAGGGGQVSAVLFWTMQELDISIYFLFCCELFELFGVNLIFVLNNLCFLLFQFNWPHILSDEQSLYYAFGFLSFSLSLTFTLNKWVVIWCITHCNWVKWIIWTIIPISYMYVL